MKKRRKTIGEDPLDLLVPGKKAERQSRAIEVSKKGLSVSKPRQKPKLPAKELKVQKIRATFHLPEDLFDECRDAVVHLSGPPVRLTLADMAEKALRTEIGRLQRKHNKGRKFPRRDKDLVGGRPVGS